MQIPQDQEVEKMRIQRSQMVRNMFQVENLEGLDIFSTIHHLSQIGEALSCRIAEDPDLSGPRWRLMLRLFISERMGDTEGLKPTDLSHSQRVSKNTISALLRGLEDKGLIQRTLDANDLRIFRIQLTDEGRQSIIQNAPRRIAFMHEMLNSLTPEEIHQLQGLLDKLSQSLIAQMRDCKEEQERN